MDRTVTEFSRFHAKTWYQHVLADPGLLDSLAGTRHVDTAVIGAGLAGLSTALGLVERGCEDVLVLDSGAPADGASGRNGGFVFAGFSLDNLELVRQRCGPRWPSAATAWPRPRWPAKCWPKR